MSKKISPWPATSEEAQANLTENYNYAIKTVLKDSSKISDGYHTFGELYNHRSVLAALMFSMLARYHSDTLVHKSSRHHDGGHCFGEGSGWFIVAAKLGDKPISYHFEDKYWDIVRVPAAQRSIIPFDGHSSDDVLERIEEYIQKYLPNHVPLKEDNAKVLVSMSQDWGDASNQMHSTRDEKSESRISEEDNVGSRTHNEEGD